jgi:hypothetical protein
VRIVDLGGSFKACPTLAIAKANEATNDQRLIGESSRYLDEAIELLVILVEAARELGPDEVVLVGVESPPAALEIQKGTLAFGQLNQICHLHSLPSPTTRYKYPRATAGARVGARSGASVDGDGRSRT